MKSIINNTVKKNETYIKVSKGDMMEALKTLKPNAFKVYVALMSNQDGYTTDHMQKHVQDDTGLPYNRVSEAFVELRKAGYISVTGDNEVISSHAGEPCEYKAELKAGRNNRKQLPKNGSSLPKNGSSDFRNSEVALPKIGSSTSEIRDTNTTYITNTTVNTTYIGIEPEYVSEDDYNQDYIKRTNMNFDDSELPF